MQATHLLLLLLLMHCSAAGLGRALLSSTKCLHFLAISWPFQRCLSVSHRHLLPIYHHIFTIVSHHHHHIYCCLPVLPSFVPSLSFLQGCWAEHPLILFQGNGEGCTVPQHCDSRGRELPHRSRRVQHPGQHLQPPVLSPLLDRRESEPSCAPPLAQGLFRTGAFVY